MKTIGISKNIRDLIRSNADEGETINDTIARLLDNAENLQPYDANKKSNRTNISISEENFNRLQDLKSDKESYNSVIQRLILSENVPLD